MVFQQDKLSIDELLGDYRSLIRKLTHRHALEDFNTDAKNYENIRLVSGR